MKTFIPAALIALFATPAFATIDSWTQIYYPIHSMQDDGYCFVPALAWDGISNIGTRQMVAAQAMSRSFRVQTLQAGEDSDGLSQNVNELYQSGVSFAIEAAGLSDDKKMDEAKMVIDVTAGAKNEKIKLAIYTGVINALDGEIKKVFVEIKGLPDQGGMKDPIPSKFNFPFTSRESPYLKKIAKEIGVRGIGISNCQ